MCIIRISRRFASITLLASLLLTGCAKIKNIPGVKSVQPVIVPPPIPVLVRPQLNDTIAVFAQMVQAYLPQNRDVVIEVDSMINNSGLEKELPSDIGPFFASAINRIGPPFRSFRTWENFPVRGPAMLPPRDQPKLPTPTYKLVGTLVGASEAGVKVGNVNVQLSPRKTDVGISKDHRETVTDLTVECTLEGPDRLAVPGATAIYRIRVRRNEQGNSFGVYFAGSGLGKESKLSETQDVRDALYDVAAASTINLLGRALLVPYYRSGALFDTDETLNNRVRSLLNQLAREQLEQNIKRLLFIDGDYGMSYNGAGELTDADRAVVVLKMRNHSLDFSDRAQLAQFAYDLWANLNFAEGAKRVQALNEAIKRKAEEDAIAAARNPPPEPGKTPAEFGWPADTRMVVLDLYFVPLAMRERVFAALRQCIGCEEMKHLDPDRAITGIRTLPASERRFSKGQPVGPPLPEQIQQALRRSSLPIELIWPKPGQRLVLKPQPQ